MLAYTYYHAYIYNHIIQYTCELTTHTYSYIQLILTLNHTLIYTIIVYYDYVIYRANVTYRCIVRPGEGYIAVQGERLQAYHFE